jgi:mannose-6-phosphate isomerase-like protein (cupin superfamily)
MRELETVNLPFKADLFAPDSSEIRLLSKLPGGSLCHCTLPPHTISKAIKHKSVEEIWYFLHGMGEIWRKLGGQEKIVRVKAGLSLTIPRQTEFQFRNTGSEPLCFLCLTMPPWPGAEEAEFVNGHWQHE